MTMASNSSSSRRSSIRWQAWRTVVRSRPNPWPTSRMLSRSVTCATYIAIWRTRLTASAERAGLRNSLPQTPNSAAAMSITPSQAMATHSSGGTVARATGAASASFLREDRASSIRQRRETMPDAGSAGDRAGPASPASGPSSFCLAAVIRTNTPSTIGICSFIKAAIGSEQNRNKFPRRTLYRLAFARLFHATHSEPGPVFPPPSAPRG